MFITKAFVPILGGRPAPVSFARIFQLDTKTGKQRSLLSFGSVPEFSSQETKFTLSSESFGDQINSYQNDTRWQQINNTDTLRMIASEADNLKFRRNIRK